MSTLAFFTTLFAAWALLYAALPLWLAVRGWLVSAGLVQVIGAFSPALWQSIFWPNEAGNFYLLVLMMLPMPLCLLLFGGGFLIYGWARLLVRSLSKVNVR